MKHRFYSRSKNEQIRIQFSIGVSAFIIIMLFFFISWLTGIYLIGIFTTAIVLSIIAPFIDAPALRKSGRLIYFSPLFITEKPNNGVIKIHGGTLFDYIFVIDRKMNGKQRTDFIIHQYLEGILNLIEKYEGSETSDLKIIGTSYIINERTARKLGFKMKSTNYLQKFILIYNYFNILISNSIAKNKISFPHLNKTKTFEADFKKLLQRKDYIKKLSEGIQKTKLIR